MVSAGGLHGTSSPLADRASIVNVQARRGSRVALVRNVPSGPTDASGLAQPPSLRTSLILAGGSLPTNLPTTCGVRSADTAGYCSHTWRPAGAAAAAARPSSPAVAAYSAAPCATSVIGSWPSAIVDSSFAATRARTIGITVG